MKRKNYNVPTPKTKTKPKFKIGQVVQLDTEFMKTENKEFRKIIHRFYSKEVGWMYMTKGNWFAAEIWIKPLTAKEAGR